MNQSADSHDTLSRLLAKDEVQAERFVQLFDSADDKETIEALAGSIRQLRELAKNETVLLTREGLEMNVEMKVEELTGLDVWDWPLCCIDWKQCADEWEETCETVRVNGVEFLYDPNE